MNIRIPLTAILFAGFLVVPQQRCQATLASFLGKTMLLAGLTAGAVYGVVLTLRYLRANPARPQSFGPASSTSRHTLTSRVSSSNIRRPATVSPSVSHNTSATMSDFFSNSSGGRQCMSFLNDVGIDFKKAEENRPTGEQLDALNERVSENQTKLIRNSSMYGGRSYQSLTSSSLAHLQQSSLADGVTQGFNGVVSQYGSTVTDLRRGTAKAIHSVADVVNSPTYFQRFSRGLRSIFG